MPSEEKNFSQPNATGPHNRGRADREEGRTSRKQCALRCVTAPGTSHHHAKCLFHAHQTSVCSVCLCLLRHHPRGRCHACVRCCKKPSKRTSSREAGRRAVYVWEGKRIHAATEKCGMLLSSSHVCRPILSHCPQSKMLPVTPPPLRPTMPAHPVLSLLSCLKNEQMSSLPAHAQHVCPSQVSNKMFGIEYQQTMSFGEAGKCHGRETCSGEAGSRNV